MAGCLDPVSNTHSLTVTCDLSQELPGPWVEVELERCHLTVLAAVEDDCEVSVKVNAEMTGSFVSSMRMSKSLRQLANLYIKPRKFAPKTSRLSDQTFKDGSCLMMASLGVLITNRLGW